MTIEDTIIQDAAQRSTINSMCEAIRTEWINMLLRQDAERHHSEAQLLSEHSI